MKGILVTCVLALTAENNANQNSNIDLVDYFSPYIGWEIFAYYSHDCHAEYAFFINKDIYSNVIKWYYQRLNYLNFINCINLNVREWLIRFYIGMIIVSLK